MVFSSRFESFLLDLVMKPRKFAYMAWGQLLFWINFLITIKNREDKEESKANLELFMLLI